MKKRQKEIRAPRFIGRAASEAASKAKRRTPRRDTRPELELRRLLWAQGLRYRKNVTFLAGAPDLVFLKQRVVVFCDGDFWHGRDWPSRRRKLARGANSEYWLAKIASNMQRDVRVTASLRADGWTVVRVWERDVKHNLQSVLEQVLQALANSPDQ